MRQDKYNPYVSQKPTETSTTSRPYKRRQWRNSWKKFLAKEDSMNFQREVRRYAWLKNWASFRDMKGSSV
jgi:hypothetical protein